MANTRTALVDRRMIEHIIQAVPGDVDERVIKGHLNNAALSHKLIGELLATDPSQVNQALFAQALARASTAVRGFASADILEQVRSLGGQFTGARFTAVPGGETLEEQRRRQVIKFWTDWHWKKEKRARLSVEPSIPSQVIYLSDLVEGSLRCTYDKTKEEGRLYVEEVLASLPGVAGLKWIVGNTPTVLRVLTNHLKETGVYLLPNVYTWTSDSYRDPEYTGFLRLLVGYLRAHGVDVNYLEPAHWLARVGLFVLGVPG